ncbi:hypothetical protein [Microbacterium album]|uniref:Uncharacterized protein n=1 Tax=Microbacterium album TaxID=2053191 RepID=A0A917IEB1_9MICO|nr:hypothetical protein [Microbacterium album]GGH40939.1 hypothetical protein GCM10010921_13200 [Microbacterium album]
MSTVVEELDGVVDPTGAPAAAGEEPGALRDARQVAEYYYQRGWTDGLPVAPCTEEAIEQFLARTSRDPDEPVLVMAHLNRMCTVREAAINAIMAGCLPEYFPVVLAAWDSLHALGVGPSALWQSTSGSAPFLVVNGPVIDEIGINAAGNVFGSGFRANATIGRAIRLATLNVFQLKPHLLDQATQASPAKYTCCIGENEPQNPWAPFHEEYGFSREDSTVTAMLIRGTLYMEARHTSDPEQLLADFADSLSRTGRNAGQSCLVLSPGHARVLAEAGWSKADVREYLRDNAVRPIADMDRAGKGGVSRQRGYLLPIEHPDAMNPGGKREPYRFVRQPEDVFIVVAGADNAGVSTIVEIIAPNSTSGTGRQAPVPVKVETA